jgi:hypothetical protein
MRLESTDLNQQLEFNNEDGVREDRLPSISETLDRKRSNTLPRASFLENALLLHVPPVWPHSDFHQQWNIE